MSVEKLNTEMPAIKEKDLLDFKVLKQDLLQLLHDHEIPEFNLSIKKFKSNKDECLACYRALSQFRDKPIMTLDVEQHKKSLEEEGIYNIVSLKNHVMDTLGHEYGHIMEEYVRVAAFETKDKTLVTKILDAFEDYEDFAEGVGKWMNKQFYNTDKQVEVIKEVVKFYVDNVFLPESIEWVRQEKWKRELDYFLDSNEKSLSGYGTVEGSFNKCKQASEAIASRLAKIPKLDVKVIRMEGYNGDLTQAHNKWKKLENEHIVHYAVLLDHNNVIDLTAKQFNPEMPERLILSLEEVKKSWNNVEIYQDYTVKANGKGKELKMVR
jgi:hypothetical protein